MLSVSTLLLLTAFVVTIAAALGRAPLWVAVFLMLVVELLKILPR